MSAPAVAVLAALPWVLLPAAVLWQLHGTRSLDESSAVPFADPPLVSIVIPARDEARNIEACMRSVLSSSWPAIELIVVDDQSTDRTGEIARGVAAADAPVRVIENPVLPAGWFGKQWACHNGARAARGTFLLFTDADTRHGPELLTRSMHAMRARGADLLSVGGSQVMVTFWERLLQPHIFALLIARYGNTERVSRSTNPYSKIANGQFMLMRRDAYERTGGHEAVRSHVAEDLRMAQEWCRLGFSVQLVEGLDHMSTRMYHGFGEIARGWGKNLFAAGRDTISLGRAGRAALRIAFPLPALWEIVPAAVAVAALFGAVSPAAGAWGAIAYAASALYWVVLHHLMRAPLPYALLHPLASLAIFGIFTRAAWKGGKVEWKGREYISR
ncbi:MAG: glycosyltransferase [Gemmatimonadales bacterium]